jgi:hypothetical protein
MVGRPSGLSATRPSGAPSNASENLMSLDHENDSLGTRDQDSMGFEAAACDSILPRVDLCEAQPPKVTYHHGKPLLRCGIR